MECVPSLGETNLSYVVWVGSEHRAGSAHSDRRSCTVQAVIQSALIHPLLTGKTCPQA